MSGVYMCVCMFGVYVCVYVRCVYVCMSGVYVCVHVWCVSVCVWCVCVVAVTDFQSIIESDLTFALKQINKTISIYLSVTQ